MKKSYQVHFISAKSLSIDVEGLSGDEEASFYQEFSKGNNNFTTNFKDLRIIVNWAHVERLERIK